MLKVVWRWHLNKNLRLAQIRYLLLAGPYCMGGETQKETDAVYALGIR